MSHASRDTIEFYHGAPLIASVRSSMIPPVGSCISIRQQTWQVLAITFALDHADDARAIGMRCNVDLKAL